MTSVIWDTAKDGASYGGFGISMTPRDMARFGYLYLNYGRWEDKQIVPAEWVAQSPPRSKSLKAYGRLFWNIELTPFDQSYEANGTFGQLICIYPETDTVVVRTGDLAPLFEFIAMTALDLGIDTFFLPKGVPLEMILTQLGKVG